MSKVKKPLPNHNLILSLRSSKIYISSSVCFVIILAGILTYYFYFKNPVVAIVGDYKITKKEMLYRDKIQHIFYPQDPNNYGLTQLIQAYTYAQIMKNHGVEITEGLIRNEEIRINQNTKAPETLNKIKALFGDDLDAYKRVFILPTYAERIIYSDFFSKNFQAQEKSLANVKNFLTEFNKGQKSLTDFAKLKNMKTKNFKLSEKSGIVWLTENNLHKQLGLPPNEISDTTKQPPLGVQKALQEQSEQSLNSIQSWIKNILSRMKPGEVLQEPVDYNDSWLIVRYVKKLPDQTFLMEGVTIPKDNYSDWLSAETKKIKIENFLKK